MKYKEGAKIELISNIPNEILFVGSIYKQPDLLIEYGQFVRSKYDFYDEVTRFFFDNAEIIYKTRTQTFNKTTISTYFAEFFHVKMYCSLVFQKSFSLICPKFKALISAASIIGLKGSSRSQTSDFLWKN